MRDLPFSVDAFFGVFEQYNLTIWPAQTVAYVLGFLSLIAIFRPVRGSDGVISSCLGVAWLAMGAVYHAGFFAVINPLAWIFGALFILQGLLFLWTGVVRQRLAYRFTNDLSGWTGIGMMVFAMAGYPLLGLLADHVWPRVPVFGVAPCPTTIFTLGMLLLVAGRTPVHLVAIPILWSAIGGSAAWMLDVPEDLALFVAGIGSAGLFWVKARGPEA